MCIRWTCTIYSASCLKLRLLSCPSIQSNAVASGKSWEWTRACFDLLLPAFSYVGHGTVHLTILFGMKVYTSTKTTIWMRETTHMNGRLEKHWHAPGITRPEDILQRGHPAVVASDARAHLQAQNASWCLQTLRSFSVHADSGHPGMDPKILYGRNGGTKASNSADQLIIAILCSATLLLHHSTAHTVAIAL